MGKLKEKSLEIEDRFIIFNKLISFIKMAKRKFS